MQPHHVPSPRDDKAARAHLLANVQAATGTPDPGHWHSHHMALPVAAVGDFTPYPAPGYAEEKTDLHEPFLEWLAGLFTFDHAAAVSQRGLEAGR